MKALSLLPLLLLPHLAAAQQLVLRWDYDRDIPVDRFVLSYAGGTAQGVAELRVPPSAPGACGADLPATTFCAPWPECPPEGVMFFAVLAERGNERSPESQTITCMFKAAQPCTCLTEAEATQGSAQGVTPVAQQSQSAAPQTSQASAQGSAGTMGQTTRTPIQAASQPVITLHPAAGPASTARSSGTTTVTTSSSPQPVPEPFAQVLATLEAQYRQALAELTQAYQRAIQQAATEPPAQAAVTTQHATELSAQGYTRIYRQARRAWRQIYREWYTQHLQQHSIAPEVE